MFREIKKNLNTKKRRVTDLSQTFSYYYPRHYMLVIKIGQTRTLRYRRWGGVIDIQNMLKLSLTVIPPPFTITMITLPSPINPDA